MPETENQRTIRDYRRKVKGCHICSQRRINCDLREPQCKKCTSKGYKCPGFGIRYRFKDEIGEPGALAVTRVTENLPPPASYAREKQKNHVFACDGIQSFETPPFQQETEVDHDAQAAWSVSIGVKTHQAPQMMVNPYRLDAQTRFFFDYYQTHICPFLVLVDGKNNGYRRLLLPLACNFGIVREAVSAAAAGHLRARYNSFLEEADSLPSLVVESSHGFGDMLNGGESFKLLIQSYRSWKSASLMRNTISSNVEMNVFLKHEFAWMEMCGRTLMDVDGVNVFSETEELCLDPIQASAILYPELVASYINLHNAFRKAIEIYKLRACDSLQPDRAQAYLVSPETARLYNVESASKLLASLKSIVRNISPGFVEHYLVWILFIGAAESRSVEDRYFFYKKLEDVFAQTSFFNIPKTLQFLRDHVWPVWPASETVSTTLFSINPRLRDNTAANRPSEPERTQNWINVLFSRNSTFII
ncbi:hypothetical protein BKA64DRAFT_635993 [Cadophora sp. MPI-SDFR-AT-0126]|nr:hypothetical protein BKA64DRAFT_635993 [Leotiomycetes sp. MPI-SDFR-AT-0126]